MASTADSFKTRGILEVAGSEFAIHRLGPLGERAARLPFSLKVLLESLLRREDGRRVTRDHIEALLGWDPARLPEREIPFMPARVLLQDFTGVPAVVDLAAMRDAMRTMGGDPRRINPLQPVDLVIDHSVQVDFFGSADAFRRNVELEFERNRERYAFLRWGQQAFRSFRVVPPDTGIVHQVNIEYLAPVVFHRPDNGRQVAYPDTVLGTDSHTTMVNGLGVVGWGVGGIEAEAAMLGQPTVMLIPQVVGFRLHGTLASGATATDVVLTVTEMLRKKGVVGKFVEFYGSGVGSLSLADRATIANMAPEYGATIGFFPIDDETLAYMRLTGRDQGLIALVEAYAKEQGLFRTATTPDPVFSDRLELDLATVEPSLAGPRRPQDRVPLKRTRSAWRQALVDFLGEHAATLDKKAVERWVAEGGQACVAGVTPSSLGNFAAAVPVEMGGQRGELRHGSVVIAAITSCTNTSNPSVMLAAGLLARKAAARGLSVRPWVKTSLAPGSKVVTRYLAETRLDRDLERLGFHLVGYGCTTCIASGTPVLLANGTSRRIEELPAAGGGVLFGATPDGRLTPALQTAAYAQGERDCVALVLQDGRELVCTADHAILRADGEWVRADRLVPGEDRVVVGLESPIDEPGVDEIGWVLRAGEMAFTMSGPQERLRTLAFARLLGHLLGDGSISVAGQARMNVGQAIDREAVLNDIELLTGKRPRGSRYDERKWSIVLPSELTRAVVALSGVRVGRRVDQPSRLPDFVLDPSCPVAVVREFLGGVFGADGTAPALKRMSAREESAILERPAYSQSARPEHVADLKRVMDQLTLLLGSCGVETEGTRVYEFPVRHAASSYPADPDDPRIEVRLQLPDGLSFVERVGFRYCVDKSLRASAAAVYWRTIDRIHRHRQSMASRLGELHRARPDLSFKRARELAAARLVEAEPVVHPHYALLMGHDRFDRLPEAADRKFRPLHRESCGFPSPVETLRQIGARDWFAPLCARADSTSEKRYCVEKDAMAFPTMTLGVLERRPAGPRKVFDLSVEDVRSFVAGTVTVHNCIGNSGPVPEPVADGVRQGQLVVAAVLSGNRNFEGRINPVVRANYLASPPLVVAYALAGTMDFDPEHDPLGTDAQGRPVFLRDLWPSAAEVREALRAVEARLFREEYARVTEGDEHWRSMPVPAGELYTWDPASTYIKSPPFFAGMAAEPAPVADVPRARVLAMLGDSVTTDHISPAGSIAKDGPAGRYLIGLGVQPKDFNSYGARRGNHEVMLRGTFANIRLRNLLVPGVEGGWTVHLPSGERLSIYDAAMRYRQENVPLVVLAGKEYGTGSSRDWAAKGTLLLGVRAVIAESYERIHRSNLVGMGVLPLEYLPGETRETLGLTGREQYDIEGIAAGLVPGKRLTVRAVGEQGVVKEFGVIARVDTPDDVDYYRHGGLLPYVLRGMLREARV
jgi:aconitase A